MATKKGSNVCINLFGGLLWISINSQSYKWGATLDLVKFEISGSRGYFGLGGGLLWRGAYLLDSSFCPRRPSIQKLFNFGHTNQQIASTFVVVFTFD